VRAFFHLEGLVETGLEHIVDKGIGDPGFSFITTGTCSSRVLPLTMAVFAPVLPLRKRRLYQGKHLRVVIPLHVAPNACSVLSIGTICASLPWANAGIARRKTERQPAPEPFCGEKNRHCDLILLLCCAVPLRMSACVSLT
jgi:hypothetical protein